MDMLQFWMAVGQALLVALTLMLLKWAGNVNSELSKMSTWAMEHEKLDGSRHEEMLRLVTAFGKA